jgi:exonuclease VII large subunit
METHHLTKQTRLQLLSEKLLALSPDNVLKRGYSVVRKLPSQKVVTDAEVLKSGERVQITFSRGEADATID